MDMELAFIEKTFSKAANTYEHHAQMQNIMAIKLCHYLKKALDHTSNRHKLPYSVLEIGCGPGNFTKVLLQNFDIAKLCLNDLSSSMIQSNLSNLNANLAKSSLKNIAISAICANALELNKAHQELKEPFDLLVSNATFQWFNNLESSLCHLANFVRPSVIDNANLPNCKSTKSKMSKIANSDDFTSLMIKDNSNHRGGRMIAFSSFYEGNFAQIKKLTGLSLDYLNQDQIIKVLDSCTLAYQVYFDHYDQYFSSSWELFKNLKETGVTAVNNSPLKASAFKELLKSYEYHYSTDKGVKLSWCPYYVIALL